MLSKRAGKSESCSRPSVPHKLAENQLLLDDSYNANVGSMTAAVQVLAEMPGYRVLVVGDMAELGAESEACHVQVGEAAKKLLVLTAC